MTKSKSLKTVFALVSSSLLVGGCWWGGSDSSVASAKSFSAKADKFSENTNRLADDIYESCIRRVQFYRIDSHSLRQAKNNAWEACETVNKPASAQARKANQVIVNYMQAIGQIATDQVVSVEDELTKVGSALKGFSIPTGSGESISLPTASIDSGIRIANFIFGWATSRFRKEALAKAIVCTDTPLQEYSEGLELALRKGYIEGILKQELEQAKNYYNDYAAIAAESQNSSWKDFNGLTKESYSAILPIIDRRNAALSYISIIKKTSSAHKLLANVFRGGQAPPSPDSLTCRTYFTAKHSRKDNQKNADLPSTSVVSITPRQASEISNILNDYRKDILPLMAKLDDSLKTH